MFYIMIEKASKRLLNYGVAPIWNNQAELEAEFGAGNLIVSDKYTEEQFNTARSGVPNNVPLTEVCIVDIPNKKLLIDPILQDNYEKKILGDKLIDERASQIYREQAKAELISEGIINSDGTAK